MKHDHDPEGPASTDLASLMQRFFRGSLTYGLGSLVRRGLGFLLIPIYTNYLTPTEFGIVGVVLAIFSATSVIFGLGLRGAITRQYFDHADSPDRVKELIGSVYGFFLLYGALGAVVLSIVGRHTVAGFLEQVPYSPFVPLALWAAFFAAGSGILLSLFRAREQASRYVALETASGVVLLGTVAYFLVVRGEGALGQVRALWASSLVIFLASGFLIARESKPVLRLPMIRAAVAFGAPLTVHLLAGWALLAVDRLILARLVPLSEVGVYTLGYQLGMIVGAVAASLNSAWSPIFYDVASNDEDAPRTLGRLGVLNLSGTVGAALVLVLFARELVQILGGDPEYLRAASIIPIVALGYALQGVYFVTIAPVFYAQKTLLLPPLTIAAAVLNVGLNLLLIPTFGIAGAAWATLAAFGLLAAGATVLGRRILAMDFHPPHLLLLAGLLLLGPLAVPALVGLPTPARVLAKLLIVGLAGGAIVRAGVLSPRGFRSSNP